MDKIITMTLYRRPTYTKEVLEALSICNGIQDYHLIISIDGGEKRSDEVIKEARGFTACKTTILFPKHLGCDDNTKYVLSQGFQQSDYVIHLEDDTVPAFDTLKYFEWAYQFGDIQNIFTVSAYRLVKHIVKDKPYLIKKRVYFTPWGWATWKSRWEEMEKSWGIGKGWDRTLAEIILKSRYELFPEVSRIQNIGKYNGTHISSDKHYKHHTVCWMDRDKYYGHYELEL